MTSLDRYSAIIGFSGHQTLSAKTRSLVRIALMAELSNRQGSLAVTSLAAGSDQIFAECALASGSQLMAIIPCRRYERSFSDWNDLDKYRELLAQAVDTAQLSYPEPSEEAYWAAGKRIVDMAEILIAVWDGRPAGGLGGTADVVEYAQKQGTKVLRVWPPGASRN